MTMPFTYQTLSTGWRHSGIPHLGFSLANRYFIAAAGDKSLALEVGTHSSVPIAASIRKNLSGGFAFLGSDRMVAMPKFKENHALVLMFPTGEKLGSCRWVAPALAVRRTENFVMLRPVASRSTSAPFDCVGKLGIDLAFVRRLRR
jgi:hypothetical protein